MNRVLSWWTILLTIAFFSLACGDDTSGPGGTGGTGNNDPVVPDCTGDVCVCPGTLVVCEQECMDLSANFSNCGECGNRCDDGRECISGACVPMQCPPGQTSCGGECVTLADDPRYCGDCERRCFAGEDCESGQCYCPPGNAACEAVGTQGRTVGGPCTGDADCAEDSRCLRSDGFPEGTCALACERHGDCPDQTACVEEEGGVCLLRCRNDEDCRDDYDCEDIDDATGSEESDVCFSD